MMKKKSDMNRITLGTAFLVAFLFPNFSNAQEALLKPTVEAAVVLEESVADTADNETSTRPPLTGDPQKDYIHDPNLPYILKGYDLSNYPFYNRLPDVTTFNFTCDDRHDGFYASVPHKCQVYHNCLFGKRYDFLCANFTVFDQKNFICHYVSEVDCANSEKYYFRNDELYETTTTTTQAPQIIYVSRDRPRPRPRPLKPLTVKRPTRPSKRRLRPAYDYYDYAHEDDYYDDNYYYYDDEVQPVTTTTTAIPRRLKKRPRPDGNRRRLSSGQGGQGNGFNDNSNRQRQRFNPASQNGGENQSPRINGNQSPTDNNQFINTRVQAQRRPNEDRTRPVRRKLIRTTTTTTTPAPVNDDYYYYDYYEDDYVETSPATTTPSITTTTEKQILDNVSQGTAPKRKNTGFRRRRPDKQTTNNRDRISGSSPVRNNFSNIRLRPKLLSTGNAGDSRSPSLRRSQRPPVTETAARKQTENLIATELDNKFSPSDVNQNSRAHNFPEIIIEEAPLAPGIIPLESAPTDSSAQRRIGTVNDKPPVVRDRRPLRRSRPRLIHSDN